MLNITTYPAQDDAAQASKRNRPLMIVHGLYGSGRNWGVIAKRLSDTRTIVTVDLRNHGDSFQSDDHSYPAMADDLATVIEHVGAPMDVCGHSMGGKAVMALALNRPKLIEKLIVADIAPVTYAHTQQQFIDAMREVDLSQLTRRSEAEDQLAEQGVEPALRSFFTQSLDVREKRWKLNLDALEAAMPLILSFPDFDSTFEGETLFLSGADSDYVDRSYRPAIRGLFPNAHFAKIPGAGHWLHAEQPRAFEASVRAFLTMDTATAAR